MRHIKRPLGSIPSDLPKKQSEEMKKAREYFDLPPEERKGKEKVTFTAYKLPTIKTQLEKLFGGKCAYCESVYNSTAPVDIEHYRPKGAVQGVPDHDGYWWLAAEWDNLLPSCIDCNRKRKQLISKTAVSVAKDNTGKKDSFPLVDETKRGRNPTDGILDEEPLLLNPCVDEPSKFLDFTFYSKIGASIVFPRAPVTNAGLEPNSEADANQIKAATSITVYGLNRLGLVQARTRVIRQLQFLTGLISELDELVTDVKNSTATKEVKTKVELKVAAMQDHIIREIKSMADPTREYSATAQAWIKILLKKI